MLPSNRHRRFRKGGAQEIIVEEQAFQDCDNVASGNEELAFYMMPWARVMKPVPVGSLIKRVALGGKVGMEAGPWSWEWLVGVGGWLPPRAVSARCRRGGPPGSWLTSEIWTRPSEAG